MQTLNNGVNIPVILMYQINFLQRPGSLRTRSFSADIYTTPAAEIKKADNRLLLPNSEFLDNGSVSVNIHVFKI